MGHTANSLFNQNIKSADECIKVFDGVSTLGTSLEVDWLLRAAVVFAVSAMDAYFHDKIKYRAAKYSIDEMPPEMAKFRIPIRELATWDKASRKGNAIRNWVTDHYSVRPLQKQSVIADALKIVGIHSLWDTIDPLDDDKKATAKKFKDLVERRHKIAHEGDREKSRRSGKKLKPISRDDVVEWINFVRELVGRVETAFPK